jgi:hypothetical protein
VNGRLYRLFTASLALAVIAPLGSCVTLLRYEVLRTPTEDCEIRPNGEFCEELDRLPSATIEIWAVEILDAEEQTVIYIGDETWVAPGTTGERTAVKEQRTSRNQCTTTIRKSLVFDEDGQNLLGTYEESFRVEGPESCGDAPFGDRQRAELVGASGPVI